MAKTGAEGDEAARNSKRRKIEGAGGEEGAAVDAAVDAAPGEGEGAAVDAGKAGIPYTWVRPMQTGGAGEPQPRRMLACGALLTPPKLAEVVRPSRAHSHAPRPAAQPPRMLGGGRSAAEMQGGGGSR